MTGDGEDRPHSPPIPFRLLTLALVGLTAYRLPYALPQVVDHPVAAASWTMLLSAAAFFVVQVAPNQRVEASLRTPLCVASAVVLPPDFALLLNALALVSSRELHERRWWMISFNHLQLGAGVYIAALAAHAMPFDGLLGIVSAAVVAVFAFDVANMVLVAAAAVLLGRASPREALRGSAVPFPQFAANALLIGMIAVLVVVLYVQVAPLSIGLLLLPLWLGYAAQRSAREASERAEELAGRVQELEVLHELSTRLLSARERGDVAASGAEAVRAMAADLPADALQATVAAVTASPEHAGDTPALPVEAAAWRDELATVQSALRLAHQRLDLEDRLRASQRAEAELARQILAEGTVERSRIALDVHDNVLPYLAAVQMYADNLTEFAERADVAAVQRLAPAVVDLAVDSIKRLRDVLSDLQRQTVVPGELVPWLARAVGVARFQDGLGAELDTTGYVSDAVPHTIEVLAAETATGCLANVVRHARATAVEVCLTTREDALVLEVTDDGVGFDPSAVLNGASHGTALMRQRAALAGGSLEFDSAVGRGTTVRLRVPLPKAWPAPPATPRPTSPAHA